MFFSVSYNIKVCFTLLAFLSGMRHLESERRTTVVVAPESEVIISGTTNVNNFKCKYDLKTMKVPISLFYDDDKDQIIFKNADLQLANNCFDCGGRNINKDFRELLKTGRYPKVELKLLYVVPPEPDANVVDVGMEIKIAGITQKYIVSLSCEEQNGICVEGVLNLRLSDFELKPPSKILGMIKVNNDIQVHLSLKLKEI